MGRHHRAASKTVGSCSSHSGGRDALGQAESSFRAAALRAQLGFAAQVQIAGAPPTLFGRRPRNGDKDRFAPGVRDIASSLSAWARFLPKPLSPEARVPSRRWLELDWRSLRVAQPKYNSGAGALERRPRHDERYHEGSDFSRRALGCASLLRARWFRCEPPLERGIRRVLATAGPGRIFSIPLSTAASDQAHRHHAAAQ